MENDLEKGNNDCPNEWARQWVSPTLGLLGLLSILSTTLSTSPSMAQARQDDLKSFAEAGFAVEQGSPGSEVRFMAYRPDLPEFRFEASDCGPDGAGCKYDVYFAESGHQGKLIYRFDSFKKLEFTGGTGERTSDEMGCKVIEVETWVRIKYSKSSMRAFSTFETLEDASCGELHTDFLGGMSRQWEIGTRRYYFRGIEVLFDADEIELPPLPNPEKLEGE